MYEYICLALFFSLALCLMYIYKLHQQLAPVVPRMRKPKKVEFDLGDASDNDSLFGDDNMSLSNL
jgi:hypothetical protein